MDFLKFTHINRKKENTSISETNLGETIFRIIAEQKTEHEVFFI